MPAPGIDERRDATKPRRRGAPPARRAAPRAAWRCCARRLDGEPGVARRVDTPGRAAQGLDLQARIVRDRGAGRSPRPPGAPWPARSPRTCRRPRAARSRARSRRPCRASKPQAREQRHDLAQLAAVAAGQRRTFNAGPAPAPRAGGRTTSASPAAASADQRRVLLGRERVLLGRRLHLDEAAVAGHHEVAVDLGLRVLDVGQVDAGLAVDDPGRDRRHRHPERIGRDLARLRQAPRRQRQRHPAAGDGRRARAAVGLDDVAVDGDLPRTERAHVDRCAQRSADQPLDLLTAAAGRAPERVCVERGSIAYSAVTQPFPLPSRNGGTFSSTEAVQMTCVSPNATSAEPFRVAVAVGGDQDGAQLVGLPTVGSHAARIDYQPCYRVAADMGATRTEAHMSLAAAPAAATDRKNSRNKSIAQACLLEELFPPLVEARSDIEQDDSCGRPHRHDGRQVQAARDRRTRRHGRRVSRRARLHRQGSCREDPPRGLRRPRRIDQALPARGARGEPDQSPEHRGRHRLRQVERRHRLLRDGVAERRTAGRGAVARPPPRSVARDHDPQPGGGRAGRGALQGDRAPRSEAREHHARRRARDGAS